MPEQVTLIGVNLDVAPAPNGGGILVIQDKALPIVRIVECSPELCSTLARKFASCAVVGERASNGNGE